MKPSEAAGVHRRTVLKLAAGPIAGAGLSGFVTDLAFAARPLAHASDDIMRLEFDRTLRSRVLMRQRRGYKALTNFEPSETLQSGPPRLMGDHRERTVQLDRHHLVLP